MAPLTEEQLAMIAEHTERGVSKALRKHTRGTAAAFLFLLATSIGVYQIGQNGNADARDAIVTSGQAVSVSGCNRDFKSTQVLRGLITSAQVVQKSERDKGHLSQEQYEVGKKFYDDQLVRITLPDCLLAQNVVTSDPNATIRVPTPLRP